MYVADYQDEVRRTMSGAPPEQQAANYALGLAGEAGEVIEPLKKHLFHGRPLDLDKLRSELADVMWYVCAIANVYGISVPQALQENVAKLRARYPTGFSLAAAAARADESSNSAKEL